jgi:hypothetical protein
MKGSCVLFLLNLQNKDVHLILAQILKIKRTKQIGSLYLYTLSYGIAAWQYHLANTFSANLS